MSRLINVNATTTTKQIAFLNFNNKKAQSFIFLDQFVEFYPIVCCQLG